MNISNILEVVGGICVCMYEFGSSGGVVCDFIFSLASQQSKREGELISWKLTGRNRLNDTVFSVCVLIHFM